ncbi:MAG: hypothetical protein ACYTA5_25265 [Planctomycetota bacterium]
MNIIKYIRRYVWDEPGTLIALCIIIFVTSPRLSRYYDHATIKQVSSSASTTVCPNPRIDKIPISGSSTQFRLIYPAKNRPAVDIFNNCPRKNLPSSRWKSSTVNEETVIFEAVQKDVLQYIQEQLEAVDIQQPNVVVLHGRVMDIDGSPPPNAFIKLIQPALSTYDAQARDDGTFTMFIPKNSIQPSKQGTICRIMLQVANKIEFLTAKGPSIDPQASSVYITVQRNYLEKFNVIFVTGYTIAVLLLFRGFYLTGYRIYEHYKRQAGFCLVCKYNLTGNISGVCPECGTTIPDNVKQELQNQEPQ